MRKTVVKMVVSLLSAFLAITPSGCQAPKPAPASALIWQIEVSKFEIKGSINSIESVTKYDGSILKVAHTQHPENGNIYLIIDVTISKKDNLSTMPFDGQALVVMDASGISYHRLENDTFLEQYQYTPRLTGLPLRFGENVGWICYEIPASIASGRLTLAYTAEGSRQEIVLQK